MSEKYDRVDFIKEFGIIPYSVWNIQDSVKFNNKIYKHLKEKKGKSTRENTAKYFDGAGEKTVFRSTTSYFNPYLAKIIYQSYSQENDLVFDPFSSIVRPYMAFLTKRNYIGCEIRPEEVQKINNIMNTIYLFNSMFEEKDPEITIIEKDCRKFKHDVKFDFIFTCPPYWNHEKYSNLPNDMSNIDNYEKFLTEMMIVGNNCYDQLYNGKFCVIVSSDFRDYSEGRKNIERLIPFTSDLINVFESSGFYLYDKIVVMKPLGTAPSRTKLWNNRKTVRIHEDVLVFKKC